MSEEYPRTLEGALCPKTNEPMVEHEKHFTAPGFPEAKLWKNSSGRDFTAVEYTKLLDGEELEELMFKSKGGDDYRANCVWDSDKGRAVPKFPDPEMVTLPETNNPFTGEDHLAAEDHGKYFKITGSDDKFWKEVSGRDMPLSDWANLINGEAIEGDFLSKDSRPFTATITFNEGKVEWEFPEREQEIVEWVTCPISGDPVEDRGTYYHFPGAGGKCWKETRGAEFSADDYAKLLSGETLEERTLVTRDGEDYTADVSWDGSKGTISAKPRGEIVEPNAVDRTPVGPTR